MKLKQKMLCGMKHRRQLRKNNLRKVANIFLYISLNMCFGCLKEPSHRDGSFEYPQHVFWLKNKKNIFNYALLSWGLSESEVPYDWILAFRSIPKRIAV